MKIRSKVVVFSAVVAAVGLALLAGCTSGGNSTGSTRINSGSASLGVPIYPGAQKQDTTTSATPRPDGSAPSPTDSRPQPPDTQGSMPQPPDGGPGGYNQGPGPGGPGGMMQGALAVYTTQDSADQVISWYRDKLKDMNGFQEMTAPQAGSSAPTGQSNNSGNGAMFSVSVNGQTRTVMIRSASPGLSNGSSSAGGGTMIIIGEGMQGAPGQQQNQGTGT